VLRRVWGWLMSRRGWFPLCRRGLVAGSWIVCVHFVWLCVWEYDQGKRSVFFFFSRLPGNKVAQAKDARKGLRLPVIVADQGPIKKAGRARPQTKGANCRRAQSVSRTTCGNEDQDPHANVLLRKGAVASTTRRLGFRLTVVIHNSAGG